ncbi:hypothetical protein QJS10_CPA06g01172 [Acorus calamus]|uniref:Uncharacterized protein n=1 Tax=Acorus calamus TaxID=4465 RepID=A0AAV9EPE4_ACOCL|nr:hypothetical protein QJS10_CPA06g01172 [Acorus calamus]
MGADSILGDPGSHADSCRHNPGISGLDDTLGWIPDDLGSTTRLRSVSMAASKSAWRVRKALWRARRHAETHEKCRGRASEGSTEGTSAPSQHISKNHVE